MQGKALYAILLSIIAVLTLALAVLVIFLFTTYNNIKPANSAEASPTAAANRDVVPEDEQGKFVLFTKTDGSAENAVFNLKPSPAYKDSFMMVSITITYDMGKDKDPEGKRKAIISTYTSELREACIAYFRAQTYEDITEEAAMNKARDTLKDTFNSIMAGKSKEKLVIRVTFDKWIVQ